MVNTLKAFVEIYQANINIYINLRGSHDSLGDGYFIREAATRIRKIAI